ncbi:hypothetical protein [Pseudomarimonas salicorniae]|uniref:Uncharacterized protein n=1 Tax=Pseudomarimonas salicorniae TaxID=2933270 RepID=A0ABT0GCS2_9GAMM|nr:hypothetical protein [Lysobacter sp. CAU 1642]MCK7592344.1 hypothetical protein [Lysobacter sp. CAU 1642]
MADSQGGSGSSGAADEVAELRAALWQCYVLAGGDGEALTPDQLDSRELGLLAVDCVRDLRGFFAAARLDR